MCNAVTKAIAPERDRLQSNVLTAVVSITLILSVFITLTHPGTLNSPLRDLVLPLLISLSFGAIVLALRAATPGGVGAGVLICLCLLLPPAQNLKQDSSGRWAAFAALISLFVLSFAATRFGRSRKEHRGLAESRRGRQASQIIANLGAGAIFALAGSHAGCIAALAEAAADTASSEIGQALGGRGRLLTTLQEVAPGTDGGITTRGTLFGIISATIVVVIGYTGNFGWVKTAPTLSAACAGLLFDSLLGATLERKGSIGNDLVNFTSTVFAGALASLLT